MNLYSLSIKYPPVNPDEANEKRLQKQKQFLLAEVKRALQSHRAVAVGRADLFPFALNKLLSNSNDIVKVFRNEGIQANQTKIGFVFALVKPTRDK